jgi:hypothetical protein
MTWDIHVDGSKETSSQVTSCLLVGVLPFVTLDVLLGAVNWIFFGNSTWGPPLCALSDESFVCCVALPHSLSRRWTAGLY